MNKIQLMVTCYLLFTSFNFVIYTFIKKYFAFIMNLQFFPLLTECFMYFVDIMI